MDSLAADSPSAKMLKLRQVLVAGVLESEESYVGDLELLLTVSRLAFHFHFIAGNSGMSCNSVANIALVFVCVIDFGVWARCV